MGIALSEILIEHNQLGIALPAAAICPMIFILAAFYASPFFECTAGFLGLLSC
jgi:hypothetical protein